MIDVTTVDEISGDARARSNVVRLAAAQALTGANSAIIFATGSIVGATLAPDISLATVPLSMYVVGLAAGTLPTGAISRAYGRRVAFIIGTFAGVLGPQLVQWTMDLWPPYLFAFSFVVQAGVALVAMAILSSVDAPKPAPSDLHGGRPLLEIVQQPRFIAAAICGIVSYPMMNLVMTSAPLAMKMCGLSVSDSNFGIQWHIVAMYGPSFF